MSNYAYRILYSANHLNLEAKLNQHASNGWEPFLFSAGAGTPGLSLTGVFAAVIRKPVGDLEVWENNA